MQMTFTHDFIHREMHMKLYCRFSDVGRRSIDVTLSVLEGLGRNSPLDVADGSAERLRPGRDVGTVPPQCRRMSQESYSEGLF